jgi:predicted AAA+ superfamily ATPase
VSPKKHFVDPSLAVAALGANQDKLMNDLKTFGFMFETLVARDIKVYAEALGAQVFHYRDDTGLEADLIVELRDGSWCAFEVKLGTTQADQAAASLIRLKEKMIAQGNKAPVCLGVICGVTRFGYKRDDGVLVVPLTAMGV